MTSVLLVAHHERAEAHQLVLQTAAWLDAHGMTATMVPDEAEALGVGHLGDDDAVRRASLCVSLGGDGTMLRAVHLVASQGLAILGVNVGLLGYLTEVEPAALESALERWAAGQQAGGWRIEERMMLDVSLGEGRWAAFNEAVVERRESGHTVRVLVHIDGAPFTSYAADGMIVSTPTGSTAYALSARGPVVSPTHRALLVTPVAPHMLFDRTLVLGPDEAVALELIGHRAAVLTVDGQFVTDVSEGQTVTVRASDDVARLIRLGERRFHQILKAKFGLADR